MSKQGKIDLDGRALLVVEDDLREAPVIFIKKDRGDAHAHVQRLEARGLAVTCGVFDLLPAPELCSELEELRLYKSEHELSDSDGCGRVIWIFAIIGVIATINWVFS